MSSTDFASFRVADPTGLDSTILDSSTMDSGSASVPGLLPNPAPSHDRAIVRPNRNCWKTARAGRASVLVDGAAYFAALESSLRQARESITIIGWDFDGRIRLRQDADPEDSPPLGELLRRLVEANEKLQVNILVWSVSVLHAPGSSAEMLFGAEWQDHPRIRIKLDTHHPAYAAHHQKIVCIDDCLAYVGGMDLTVGRWDRSPHRLDEKLRIDPDGNSYQPVHDIQMVLDGDAARALSDVANDRWDAATGASVIGHCAEGRIPWPRGVEADFTDVDVAIARTVPQFGARSEISEIFQLNLDALAAARDVIYIEAQYMTSSALGDVLERQLQKSDGPEVVIVMTHECNGFVEHWVMGNNRDRLTRRLKHADRHDRLRVLYPCVNSEEECHQVFVHAKLIAVDDRFLRIGSSNLNNRSIGLDTECDVAIEASDDASSSAIRDVRDKLISEHLRVAPERLRQTVAEEGSLTRAIDRLNQETGGLRPFSAMSDNGPRRPLFGTGILDPARPFRFLKLTDKRRSRKPVSA